MRNVWKGLVVGGLTGVAAGLLIDLVEGTVERAGTAREHLRERAPELKEKARHAAEVAGERLRQAELGEKARVAAERVKDADLPEKARHAAEVARDRAREVDLTDLADKARGAIRP
ncbi:MAG: hypothetical protein ACRDZ7_18970 [Acidimicrobiia bacterium]